MFCHVGIVSVVDNVILSRIVGFCLAFHREV